MCKNDSTGIQSTSPWYKFRLEESLTSIQDIWGVKHYTRGPRFTIEHHYRPTIFYFDLNEGKR